jgi:serine/threonine protein phosphatase PrpC
MSDLWSVDCAGVSHTGHVRRINEDAWLARPETGLFAASDGMGGHRAGEVASRMVIDALAALPAAPDARTMRQQVEGALTGVNRDLHDATGPAICGSTVVVLLLCGPHFAVLWAGDSRAYRAARDGFARVTRDHSLVQQLIEDGTLTPETARHHRLSNRITRAVGSAPALMLEGAQGELKPGDVFLLCSDGLTRHVEDDEIRGVLEGMRPRKAAERLVDLTLARGATDNVTAVVVGVRALDGAAEEAIGMPHRTGCERVERRRYVDESMQFCGVHYAANVTASLPFAGRKPG